jgi:hypothetical protein
MIIHPAGANDALPECGGRRDGPVSFCETGAAEVGRRGWGRRFSGGVSRWLPRRRGIHRARLSRVAGLPGWRVALATFGSVTALLGQCGQVAQREMAVDALVDAAKLLRAFQSENPPEHGFGLGGLTRQAMQDGLAEE